MELATPFAYLPPKNREAGMAIHGHMDKCGFYFFGFSELDGDLIVSALNSTLHFRRSIVSFNSMIKFLNWFYVMQYNGPEVR